MDFKHTFEIITHSFEKENLKYAIIGGFALEAAGVTRATMDIDLLVLANDKNIIKPIMISNGYDLVFESKEVITFIGSNDSLGRVDFLLAHRKYTLAMLERAQKRSVLQGRTEIYVVDPEDLIGLKIQAVANDRHRFNQDMADIQMIITSKSETLNFNRIKEYFELFDKLDDYNKLLNDLKNAD